MATEWLHYYLINFEEGLAAYRKLLEKHPDTPCTILLKDGKAAFKISERYRQAMFVGILNDQKIAYETRTAFPNGFVDLY